MSDDNQKPDNKDECIQRKNIIKCKVKDYPGLPPPPPLHPGIAAPGRHTLEHSCGSPVGWLEQCGFPCSPGLCGLSAKTIGGEVTTPIPNNIAKQQAMKKFSLYIPNIIDITL
jgi:hypothetical protein